MTTPKLYTPLEKFFEWEQKYPDRIFFHQPVSGAMRTYTYRQAGEEIRRIAAYLVQHFPKGSCIGLVSKNCAHWIMTDLAIALSGNISIPIYPTVTADTVNYILRHCEAKALFTGKLDVWDAMKKGVPKDVQVISFPLYGAKGDYVQWDDILKNTQPLDNYPSIGLNELMTIVYTSGTTGNPKGVMLKCRAIAYAVTMAMEVLKLGPERPRFFSYLPLSHIAERMLVEMGSLYTGGEVHFAESLDTFAKNLAAAKPTLFLGVPRIWTKFQMGILEKLPQKKLDLLLSIPIVSSIIKKKIRTALGLQEARNFFTGAAPMPVSLLLWYQKLGINIQDAYAMTENSAYSHLMRADNIKVGYTGQPMPNVEVKISEAGEILMKSETLMEGYYKEPELTAQAFENGFLKTGDRGELGPDGFIKITGRVKELFKTEKGKYIAPAPIEVKLSKDQHIEQVCITGAGFPQPFALIVLSQEARKKDRNAVVASLKSTLESLNPSLEPHERVHRLIIVNEEWTVDNNLMTPSLKVKRTQVEDRYSPKFSGWYEHHEVIVWE